MRLKFLKEKSKLLSHLIIVLSDTFILLCCYYPAVYQIREYISKKDLKLISYEDTVVTVRDILFIVFSGLC